MGVTKFELCLNAYDDKEEPLRTVKVELAAVDQCLQQPLVIMTDRDTGFSLAMKLPQGNYMSLQETFEQLQTHCGLPSIQKAMLAVANIFFSSR